MSPHFNLREFQCKGKKCCGGAVKVDSELLEMLEQLRVRLGKPLILSCGYRCPQHNENVAGTPNSFHTQGRAAEEQGCKGARVQRSRGETEKVSESAD